MSVERLKGEAMEQRYTLLFEDGSRRDVVGPIPRVNDIITFKVGEEYEFYIALSVTHELGGFTRRGVMRAQKTTVHVNVFHTA